MDKQVNKLLFTAVGYLLFSLVTLAVVAFAWFAITSQSASLVNVSAVNLDVSYEYYYYKEYDEENEHVGIRFGSVGDEITLKDNVGTGSNTKVYHFIENPQPEDLIPHQISPGDTYSFALKLDVRTNRNILLDMSFRQVLTENFNLEKPHEKLQVAFEYSVTKIVRLNIDLEEIEFDGQTDIKDFESIQYEKNVLDVNPHDDFNSKASYELLNSLMFSSSQRYAIVFFNFYFLPEDVYVFDTDDINAPKILLENSSNILRSQQLRIGTIWLNFQ